MAPPWAFAAPLPAFRLLFLANLLTSAAYSAFYLTYPVQLRLAARSPHPLRLALPVAVFSLPALFAALRPPPPPPAAAAAACGWRAGALGAALALEGLGAALLGPAGARPAVGAARLVQGLGAALFQRALVDLIAAACCAAAPPAAAAAPPLPPPPDARERAGVLMGVLELGALLGTSVGPLAAVVLGRWIGVGPFYVLLGAVVCLLGLVVWRALHGRQGREGGGEGASRGESAADAHLGGPLGLYPAMGHPSEEGRGDGVADLMTFWWVWVMAMAALVAMMSFAFLRPALALYLLDRGYSEAEAAGVFALVPVAYLVASAVATSASGAGKYASRSIIIAGLLLVAGAYHYFGRGLVGPVAVVFVSLGATSAFVPTMTDISRVAGVGDWGRWDSVSSLCAMLFALGEFWGPLVEGILSARLGSFRHAARVWSAFVLVVAVFCCLVTLIGAIFDLLKSSDQPQPDENAERRPLLR